eukprot:TRINITY_DN905_c0_g1_i2.p1 TRINITY_DN905_c0_g1~~TRINITY_DN905_c0_g1_i2.p1  ORF type:complete len:241 (+),score=59.50 TRINITY_DN905_c0_g1_i2:87-809(+)
MLANSPRKAEQNHVEIDDFDFLFKIILVGNQGVGKTSVVNRFVKNTYCEESKPTIGVEFATRTITVDGKKVRIQIWDTAGQERFRGLTHTYYRGAVAALVVYDIQSKPSFLACERWISELRQNCDNKDLAVILVGNKLDQKHLREVPRDEAERFGVQQESMWLETSAADGTGIEEAFVELVRNALKKKGAVNAESAASGPSDAVGKRRIESVIRLEKFEPVTIQVSGAPETAQSSGGCSC